MPTWFKRWRTSWLRMEIARGPGTLGSLDVPEFDCKIPSKIKWYLTRAIRHSPLGVRSVGPVGDFLECIVYL